jgi:hypothetical protein
MYPYRVFRDRAGVEWQVFEVKRLPDAESLIPAGLRGGWLSFRNATERRRLAPAPDEWQRKSDKELIAYLERAEPG